MSIISDPIIKLSVGAEATILQVHQRVLCSTSEYFKNAMKPEWAQRRADPYTIDLSEDHLKDVAPYILWLKIQHIRAQKVTDGSFDPNDPDDQQELGKVLIKAYLYSQKVIDDAYRKAIIRYLFLLHDTYNWIPRPDALSMLYDATSIGDSARRLMQDFMSHEADGDRGPQMYWEHIPQGLRIGC